ncbi:MAG TPA: serine hydrolase [Thermoanaerobaculia bacterium]|nr:serine hydrolase [Thermoanaerobaculia bacterium]
MPKLLVVHLAVATPLVAAPAGDGAARLDGFDGYVQELVEEWGVPGLALAVVHDGEVLFERGYGVRELGRDEEVDERTLFAIGSTTKAMTAAAVGMLVDEGKVGWEDPVTRHLPWLELRDPSATRGLRVRDLLTHDSGLPNTDFLWYEQDSSTEEIVRRLAQVELQAPPRARFVYQNVMYAAAGLLVEAASGEPWSRFVESRILRPLGMDGSTATLRAAGREANRATPHDVVEGELRAIENASVDNVAAAGSVWSSASDMSKWSAFLLRGGVGADGRRLLSEATFGELFRPQVIVDADGFYPTARLTRPNWTTYSLGWFQADYQGRRVDFHTGSIDGMVAIHGLVRAEGLGVIVLANLDHAEVRHALMYHVLDLFSPASEPGAPASRDWSTELRTLYAELQREAETARERRVQQRVGGTRPSLSLASYAGRYRDPLHGEVEVTESSGGGLRLRWGRRVATLEHWHYDTFRAPWDARWRGEERATFVLGASGEVERLELGSAAFRRVASQR